MTFYESQTQEAKLPVGRRTAIVAGLRSKTGVEFPLASQPRRWVVGTAATCDLVLDDPYVSAMHCVLERRPGGAVVVRDRRSRNGTLIDGNLIEAGELHVGARLGVGRTTLVAVGAPGPATDALGALRGKDPVFRATVEQARKAALTECSVLIIGETGTGKDVLARVIHEGSRRAGEALVAVNCGAIPRELIGSELFGHEKGAFTGAHAERDGYFVEAHGGTLFLDEIGELPLEMQPHLLRVLESRKVRRLGGGGERAVDVRIVAATNRLEHLGTEASKLRLDLYHRLATVVLVLPPLRERIGDLPELVLSLLAELAPEYGEKVVTDEAWKALAANPWPGNVRELRHAVVRAVALGGDELLPEHFFPAMPLARPSPLPMPSFAAMPASVPAPVEDLVPYERVLRSAMERAIASHGTIRAAAQHLGMPKSTFADRAQKWGLVPRDRPRLPMRGRSD
ncbi:MAG TPA: sigma 54-interacting transcriptional regulator [Kofleriaceae bacterium]|nr:sigma 54-interacting transcriptional regulator [Kofleriaceae bacterium]